MGHWPHCQNFAREWWRQRKYARVHHAHIANRAIRPLEFLTRIVRIERFNEAR